MYLFLSILFFLFPPEDKIIIKDAWLRPSSQNMTTALYFIIENKAETPDTLFKLDSDIAAKIEIHETYTQNEMMGMRKVDFIVIPAKDTFQFKPGSYHIMLMKLKKDINDGDKIELVLHFKQTGNIKVTATAEKLK